MSGTSATIDTGTRAILALCGIAAISGGMALAINADAMQWLPSNSQYLPIGATLTGFAMLGLTQIALALRMTTTAVLILSGLAVLAVTISIISGGNDISDVGLFLFGVNTLSVILVGLSKRRPWALLPAFFSALLGLTLAGMLFIRGFLGTDQVDILLVSTNNSMQGGHLVLATGALAGAIGVMATVDWTHVQRAVVGWITLFALVGAGGWAALMWVDHDRTLNEIRSETTNIARLLEEHAQRSLDPVRIVLRQVKDVVDTKGMHAVANSRAQWEAFRALRQDLPQLANIAIIDAEGAVQLLTTRFPIDPIQFDDREYYKAHANGAKEYYGKLVIARTTKAPVSTYSLRLEDEANHFTGLVLASLEGNYFRSFYEALDLGPEAALSLFRVDGRPIIRKPLPPDFHLADLHDSPLFAKYLPEAPAGIYVDRSPIDGAVKMVAYRRLENAPLVATAAMDTSGATKAFEARMLAGALILLGALLGLAAATHLQIEAQRREAKARREAIESRDFTDSVLNSIGAHVAILDGDGNLVSTNAAWQHFEDSNTLGPARGPIGANYFDICQARIQSNGEISAPARAALEGIKAVRDGGCRNSPWTTLGSRPPITPGSTCESRG